MARNHTVCGGSLNSFFSFRLDHRVRWSSQSTSSVMAADFGYSDREFAAANRREAKDFFLNIRREPEHLRHLADPLARDGTQAREVRVVCGLAALP